MKRILLILLALISHISVAFAITLPLASQQQLNALVDTAFGIYKQHHLADWTTQKQESIIIRANIYTHNTKDPLLKGALEHLIALLVARQPTTPPSVEPPVYLTQDTLSYEAWNKTILAGEESPIIGKLSYIAQNEAIFIDTLHITSNQSLANYIDRINIYDTQGKRVLRIPTTTESIELHDLAWKLPQWQNTFWVTVQPKKIMNTSTADMIAGITITLAPTRLISSTTHESYSSSITHTVDELTISPVIISKVAFVDEAVQRKRDTHLREGTTNLGIIAITTPQRDNTRKTTSHQSNLRLQTLRIGVNDGTTAQQIKPTLMLKRLWTAMNAIGGTIDGDSVIFDLSAIGAFAELWAGKTTYRLVTAEPELTMGSSESVQLVLQDFLGWTITFGTDEPGSDTITQLSLPENTIEWPMVYE